MKIQFIVGELSSIHLLFGELKLISKMSCDISLKGKSSEVTIQWYKHGGGKNLKVSKHATY